MTAFISSGTKQLPSSSNIIILLVTLHADYFFLIAPFPKFGTLKKIASYFTYFQIKLIIKKAIPL